MNCIVLQRLSMNLFQNVHLVARWLNTLEKKLEQYSLESHENYRVFISAEPSPTHESHIIPQGILESSVKITNEPPTGMFANLHKSLDNFTQVSLGLLCRQTQLQDKLGERQMKEVEREDRKRLKHCIC